MARATAVSIQQARIAHGSQFENFLKVSVYTMSFCGVFGCTNSTRKACLHSLKADEAYKESHTQVNKVVLDDKGTAFVGTNIRYHCMPRKPRLRDNATAAQRSDYKRQVKLRKDWIHALNRSDDLSNDIRVCSLHFSPSAYDPLAPMKAGVESFLTVPTRNLLLADAVPTMNLDGSNNKKSSIETARSKRMSKKESQEVVSKLLKER